MGRPSLLVIDEPVMPFNLCIIDEMSARTQRADTAGGQTPNWTLRTVRPGSLVIILAAMMALLWQSCVTQSHTHFDRHAAVESAGQLSKLATGNPPLDSTDNCPVCREIAHAGHYTMSAAITFHLPRAVSREHYITSTLTLPRKARSHSWRSRAPPQLLQT
jgi:hypothetical protein